MPGGDAAVRQPWRMALSYLRDAFGTQLPDNLARFPGVSPKQVELIDAMLARRVQTVETSSCGRLFDAVAAILGIASEVTFEGQAAIALETVAARAAISSNARPYPFDLTGSAPIVIDLRATIRAIAADHAQEKPPEEIAARFHRTLAAAILEICLRLRKDLALDHICLSGGTFQNHILLVSTVLELRRHGFEVFLHTQVPANDGGIALGQAVIANALMRRDR
jgi:hydrogenase maturation protein HypF